MKQEAERRQQAAAPQEGAPPAHVGRAMLDSLTGLRFFAALSVFVSHASSLVFPSFADQRTNASFNAAAGALAGLGVSFFFTLSGFVLTWSARSTDRTSGFYRRRFVKILPLYYVVGVVAAVLLWDVGVRWQDLLAYAGLVQVWVPNPQVNFSVLAPGWSLAVEAVFYLVFPLVIRWFRGVGRRVAWTGLALCVAVAFLVPILAYVLPAGTGELVGAPSATGFEMWFAYVFPLGRLCDFFAGVFAALLVTSGRFPRVSLPWVLVSFVPCYVAASYSPLLFGWRAPLFISSVLLIVAAAQRDIARRPTFLSSRTMVLLGNMSFAFYLCHYLVLYTLNIKLLHGPFDSVAMVIAYLASALVASVTVAWLLYRYVEMPIVRRFGTAQERL
ncbi:acyltransferase family protein [Streptomyces sp. NBC_00576]|uniref:acyltransferase family protein n=1 Tax=Streptomyces sp. NBC_00576 TaxID=2903665 RepID=UPI002E7FC895|nr:acyltransferase [Streptomyces sp. NBC_00576]WUB73463.1 acyltransferase [Streptomyces sp. NBC_00576]